MPTTPPGGAIRVSMRTAALSLALVASLMGAPGCGDHSHPSSPTSSHSQRSLETGDRAPRDHTAHDGWSLPDVDAIDRARTDGRLAHRPDEPFRQISLMFSVVGSGEPLEYRVQFEGGTWSDWRDVEVTWREGPARVGRGLLERPAVAVEFREGAPLRSLYTEFPSRQTARTERPLARELPVVGESEDYGDDVETRRQRAAPRSLVIPRKQWKARDPDKECGYPHNPYRMSIHHTYRPADDGGNPARRMRQMQAYHIDNRGWCDIGYHFVVSQSGKIYQGRSTEKRTGAHVGGENDGNIGISLIGDYQNNPVITSQLRVASKIVRWVHRTYQIPLDRQRVKGHREWPGQSTSCPGDNLLPKLPKLLQWASQQPTTGDYDVAIDVQTRGLRHVYDQGSSDDVSDALPGERFRAQLLVTNRSDEPIRDVWLGYQFQAPWLEAVSYTIYTDHPEHDRSSWSINDADSAPENPPDDQMGSKGKLDLYAFSPGETKRIRVVLKAKRYSLGAVEHPDVRAWVRQVRGVYETKTSWNDTPTTNEIGADLRARSQLDIPSRSEWQFDSTASRRDLEGWEACCGGSYESFELDRTAGALAVDVDSPNMRLLSPPWTRIDADTYDQLVLRMRSNAGAHRTALYWSGQKGAFSRERGLQFRVPGDGSFHTIVVPLGEHDAWSGEIVGLRLAPFYGGDEQTSKSHSHAIDAIYFQSSKREATSSNRSSYVDRSPVDIEPVVESDTSPPKRYDAGGGSDTGAPPVHGDASFADVGAGRNDANARRAPTAEPPRAHRTVNIPVSKPFDSTDARVDEGCSTTGGTQPLPWLGLLFGIVGYVRGGRRRSSIVP